MISVEYKCDKCGEKWPKDAKRQLWRLQLKISSYPVANDYCYTDKREAEWCRSCIVKAGLLPSCPKDPSAPETPATIEELIRDIVREEID